MAITLSGTTLTQANETAKSIISVATHADGINVEVTAHAYVAGDWVRVTGTTDYNGDYEVLAVIDTNQFIMNATFTSTQTGSVARGDKDYSDLESLTGIEVLDLGVTDYPYKIYDATDFTLEISGSIRQNHFEEFLLVDQFNVANGGIHTCGINKNEPSTAGSEFVAQVPLPAIHVKKRGTHPQNDPGVQIVSGGKLILNGSMIHLHSGFRSLYISDAVQGEIEINNGYIYIEGLATQNSLPYKVRFDGTRIRINGLKQYGGAFATERVLDEFSGYEPTHYEGWQVPIQSDQTIFFVAEGYRGGGRGNIQDIRWTATKMRFKNCLTGPNTIAASHQTQSGSHETTQEINFKVTDLDNNNIEGARHFIRDVDNGNRANYTSNGNNDNYVDDRTHTGVTGADGTGDTIEVLTSVTVDNGANNDGTVRDHRSKSNDVNALFDIPFWSYNHVYTPIPDAKLVSDLPITFPVKMPIDLNVTGTAAEAAAHNVTFASDADGISIVINESMTLDDLYDVFKYTKTLVAGIELPTVDTQFCTADGSVRDFGGIDIMLSDNVVLSAGTKGRSMTTTGEITFGDGASITTPYSDSAGQSILISTESLGLAYIEEVVGDVSTFHEETADSDGRINILVDAEATIHVTAKKYGYMDKHISFDVADVNSAAADLTRDANVNTSLDLSSYGDADQTSDVDKIHFVYDATKSSLVFGEIDLRSEPALSKALFDNRISTFAGLKWLHNYNADGTYDDYLNGRAYQINSDQISIIEDTLDFTRVADMTIDQKSHNGINVKKKDGTNYSPPVSNNDDVRIPPVQILPILSENILIKVFRRAAIDDTFLDGIKGPIAAETLERMNDAPIVNTHIDFTLVASNTDMTQEDIRTITYSDDTVDIEGASTGKSYIILQTDIDISFRHTSKLSLKLKGAVNGSDDIAEDTTVTGYLDTDIDEITDIDQYITDNTEFLDSDGTEKTINNTPTASYNRIIIIFSHATLQPTLKLSNLSVTAHHSEYAASGARLDYERTQLLEKLYKSDIAMAADGETYNLVYEDITLATFNRRSGTVTTDWSGGRTLQ